MLRLRPQSSSPSSPSSLKPPIKSSIGSVIAIAPLSVLKGGIATDPRFALVFSLVILAYRIQVHQVILEIIHRLIFVVSPLPSSPQRGDSLRSTNSSLILSQVAKAFHTNHLRPVHGPPHRRQRYSSSGFNSRPPHRSVFFSSLVSICPRIHATSRSKIQVPANHGFFFQFFLSFGIPARIGMATSGRRRSKGG